MDIVIDPENFWMGNFQKLPRLLLKRGELSKDGQKLVEEFINCIKQYDYAFAYSENGTFTVVFAHNEPPVFMEDVAMMDISFDSQVALMIDADIDAVTDISPDFFDAVRELVDDNGWELSGVSPNYSAESHDFWADDDAREAIAALLDELPKHVRLSKADAAIVQKYRDGMDCAANFIAVITDQVVTGTFNVDLDEDNSEDDWEDDEDWDDEEDEENEDEETSIMYSFSITRMNGGSVVMTVGDDFINVSVPQAYIDFTVSFLEQYGKGGRFGTGEVMTFATESIKDDGLAMALITCLEENQPLTASEKELVAKVKEQYTDYPERSVILVLKMVQVICMEGQEVTQYMMYTGNGGSYAGAGIGEDVFMKEAAPEFVAALRALLTERGLEKWID